jgi:hypothetical protein
MDYVNARVVKTDLFLSPINHFILTGKPIYDVTAWPNCNNPCVEEVIFIWKQGDIISRLSQFGRFYDRLRPSDRLTGDRLTTLGNA